MESMKIVQSKTMCLGETMILSINSEMFKNINNNNKNRDKKIYYKLYRMNSHNHLFLMCLITNFLLCWKWCSFTCTNLFIDQVREKNLSRATKKILLKTSLCLYNCNKFTQCILPKINLKNENKKKSNHKQHWRSFLLHRAELVELWDKLYMQVL